MRTPFFLLAVVLLLPAGAAQVPEEATPQSRLAMESDPTAAVLTNGTGFGIALSVAFEMGFVECAEDPVIPLALEVSWSPPTTMFTVVAPEMALDGNDDLVTVTEDPPYNYRDSTEGVLVLESDGLEGYAGVLNVTVLFEGGTPDGCVATGPMPAAEATVLFDLQATAFAAPGPVKPAQNESVDESLPDDPKDKDSPGGRAAASAILVAAFLARRRM